MSERRVMKGEETRSGNGSAPSADDVWRAVGLRLAGRRLELGYSADEVAAAVGIEATEYAPYEQGAPIPAFLLGDLARLLGCSVAWFFDGLAQPASDAGEQPDGDAATYKVATVEHRIQVLTDSFRKLDFEGQQHLLAISRALCRASAGGAADTAQE